MTQDRRIIETVTHDGQKFVDEPIVVNLRASVLQRSIAKIFSEEPAPIVIGHTRVRLRWMRPDGKGGFVPRTP